MRKSFVSLAALALLAVSHAQDRSKFGNFDAITAARLRAHLEFVASDLLEGRDTPSRGQDVAALYVATQLKLWGVKPAGDNGTYFQTIVLGQPAVDAEATTLSFGGKARKFGEGYYSLATAGKADGTLVFVGDGAECPSLGAEPYKSVDVKGRIVIRTNTFPKGYSRADIRSGKLKDFKAANEAAAAHGAVAILQILDPGSMDSWNSNVERATQQGRPQMQSAANSSRIPVITISPEFARELMAGEAANVDDIIKRAQEQVANGSFSLKADKKLSVQVSTKGNPQTTQNVVGIVTGSDPKLKDEFVALGAHIDHVGKRDNMQGDNIFNGADDDGSGTVSILEIAHAMATGPKPKRSILFVWHTGEEKGLWGSSYFTNNPTVPITSIVSQLNIDMIGRSKKPGDTNPANKMLTDPNAIYVVGAKKLSTDLGSAVDKVNGSMYKLNYDYHYDAPNDPESIYTRSDHYNYAVKGIPIAFWFDGVHEDYHRPGDEVQKIDFNKMQQVARTVCGTAFFLANEASRPKVDKSGQ